MIGCGDLARSGGRLKMEREEISIMNLDFKGKLLLQLQSISTDISRM
jgi:hypothetical protein